MPGSNVGSFGSGIDESGRVDMVAIRGEVSRGVAPSWLFFLAPPLWI